MRDLYVRSIYVEGFRGIRKLASPLRLAKFNLVLGRNNSGKTALLEALYLIPHPHLPAVLPSIGRRIDLIAGMHCGYQSLIYGYSGEALISCELGGLTLKVKIDEKGGAEVFVDSQRASTPSSVADSMKVGEKALWSSSYFIPSDTLFLERVQAELLKDDVWSRVVKVGAHVSTVKELVNPAVSDTFTEVLIEKGRLKLRKEGEEGPLYIHVSDLGRGVQRVLTIALTLEYLKPSLVLWDSLESSAHPGLIEVVLDWLSRGESQVVISTHSLDVLYEYARISPLDSQVILLRKDRNDVVRYRIFSPEELDELLNGGVDPRKIVGVIKL